MRCILKAFFIALILLTACRQPAVQKGQTIGRVERLAAALNELIPEQAEIEILARDFGWSEGPVWIKDGSYLLFNDIPANTLYKWADEEGLSVFLRPAGPSIVQGEVMGQFGCNGLFVNPVNNRLVLCEHGNRCLTELDEKQWVKHILADRYEGKRFNSPNDLVISGKGDIYFTDPPYGLKSVDGSQDKNPLKELSFNGVFHCHPDGRISLITDELDRPNGIALSPDEKTLYVANSGEKAIWMAFDLDEKGTAGNGRLFYDATTLKTSGKQGSCDGMAVDSEGNLWATGPGGVLVITGEGKHLGTIETGERIANCCFGGRQGNELFMTSDMYLCRIRVSARGIGF